MYHIKYGSRQIKHADPINERAKNDLSVYSTSIEHDNFSTKK